MQQPETDGSAGSGRIYISELAALIVRAEQTIYQWVSREQLPDHLLPQREGGRRRMWWTLSQVEGMREFADEKAARWRGNRSSA